MNTPSFDPTQLGLREAWSREPVTSSETTLREQMGKVFDFLKGLHGTHLIDVGVKLGLFSRLAEFPDGLAPDELARDTGLHPRYVSLWCDAACALEMLDYDPSSGYRLAPFMDQVLGNPDATFYLGRFPQAHLQVTRDYERYPDLFATGNVFPYQEHDGPFLRAVAEALCTLPRMFLETALPNLPGLEARLYGGATILDVGCGGGYAIVEFARRFPKVRCVGIDVEPNSIQMAQELIRSQGLEDRVEARRLDGTSLPEEFEGAFDLVTSFMVLHEIQPDLKMNALSQCERALRPDGQLLIFDEQYPGSPSELRDPSLLFAVIAQWYEMTWGNIVNTKEEIHDMLSQIGLRVVDETALSRFYIVTAEKSS